MMPHVIAVDPGNKTGVARVDPTGALATATVVRKVDAFAFLVGELRSIPKGDRIAAVFEVPRVERFARSRGGKIVNVDPDDVVWLANFTGELQGIARLAGAEVITPRPSEWKGSVDKLVFQSRQFVKLPHSWHALWERCDHNGRDAILLAHWHRAKREVETWRYT